MKDGRHTGGGDGRYDDNLQTHDSSSLLTLRIQIGMLMFLIANIVGSTIQITTLPLPVLSTLQASGLVFNTACATIILSEPFTKYSVIGTVLVAAGAVLIATFGALAEPSHNLDQLLILLGRSQFLIWLFATFFVVAAIIAGMWFLGRVHPRPTLRIRLLRGMSYGAISGILSAHCLLLAKSAVELLVRTIADKHNQFNRWQSWMILLGLVFLALTQLYYLHRGLKLCSTSVLYPFVFCIYNIIAIMDGLIYFNQSSRLSVSHACLIALGTAILLGGVFCLSWRLADEPHRPGSVGLGAQDAKTMAHRVPTPQSALAPGLGLMDVDPTVGTEEESPYLGQVDDEEALSHQRPSETTPLLRTSTTPPWQRSQKRLPKTRRALTLQQQQQSEIWDELNESGENLPRLFETGLNSPRSTRSPTTSRIMGKAGDRRRAETMPARRRSIQLTSTSSNPIWNFGSWRLPGTGPRRSRSHGKDRAIVTDDDEDMPQPTSSRTSEDGDAEPDAGLLDPHRGRGRGWSLSGTRTGSDGANPVGGWFKLRWWKRRRRTDEDNSDSHTESGSPGRSDRDAARAGSGTTD
jgi:magnesium transporter